MIGVMLVDIIGSVYEWENIMTKELPLFSEKGFFIDDTVMTIAETDAIYIGGYSHYRQYRRSGLRRSPVDKGESIELSGGVAS